MKGRKFSGSLLKTELKSDQILAISKDMSMTKYHQTMLTKETIPLLEVPRHSWYYRQQYNNKYNNCDTGYSNGGSKKSISEEIDDSGILESNADVLKFKCEPPERQLEAPQTFRTKTKPKENDLLVSRSLQNEEKTQTMEGFELDLDMEVEEGEMSY